MWCATRPREQHLRGEQQQPQGVQQRQRRPASAAAAAARLRTRRRQRRSAASPCVCCCRRCCCCCCARNGDGGVVVPAPLHAAAAAASPRRQGRLPLAPQTRFHLEAAQSRTVVCVLCAVRLRRGMRHATLPSRVGVRKRSAGRHAETDSPEARLRHRLSATAPAALHSADAGASGPHRVARRSRLPVSRLRHLQTEMHPCRCARRTGGSDVGAEADSGGPARRAVQTPRRDAGSSAGAVRSAGIQKAASGEPRKGWTCVRAGANAGQRAGQRSTVSSGHG